MEWPRKIVNPQLRNAATAASTICLPGITTPYRQIRALHDAETITVYQAYNAEIASAAVARQRLDASPRFRTARMTWIKPSWCWMMYRAGYSYKDPNQARILALRMRRGHFLELLRRGGEAKSAEEVRIQWDPERSARLEKLEYRSIQVGVPAALQARWVGEWIESIEDVTEKARELKRVLDEEGGGPDVATITDAQLVENGLLPKETEFVIPQDLQEVLGMTELVKT
ncbi:hypothetical protein PG993_004280 [Apiospora rasikravindrae]|uniref:DUF4291 domain-containing protein n=1 Tax=Apiospora rasikravindrae TaxID=990691 RepID=A0ABR1TE32_9PEZI